MCPDPTKLEKNSELKEFALRPLRIQKRQDQPVTPLSSTLANGSSSDDFVCRPMRLGLSSNKISPGDSRVVSRDTIPTNTSWDTRTSSHRDTRVLLRKLHSSDSLPTISAPNSRMAVRSFSAGSMASEEHENGNQDYNPGSSGISPPRLSGRPSLSRDSLNRSTLLRLGSAHSSEVKIKNLPVLTPKRHSTVELAELDDMIFAICVVDFHHVRGPEIQWWKSNYHSSLEPNDHLFHNLPFQAMPDGSHLFEETFANFSLVYDFRSATSLDDSKDIQLYQGNPNHLETLFGCSCVRQVKSSDLSPEELAKNKDITRSIVQKAIVVISRKQPIFTKIKEKISIITHSYFKQQYFDNFELFESLFYNLNDSFKLSTTRSIRVSVDPLSHDNYEEQEEFFVNLNLREILAEFKGEILVILKAMLLEKRIMIYSNSNIELLSQFQNNLIALIPNLLNHLELSGSPLCGYEEKFSPLQKPTSLKTNDRLSMLRFFGLPLQIFNTKGSFWNPYLPLQQLDELSASSFLVGCSNLLIVNQLARFNVDVLVDLDERVLSFPNQKFEELRLTAQDKKFINSLLSTNQSRDAYIGSDDYIRYQFEDYIRSLLTTTRFKQYVDRFHVPPPGFDEQENRNLGAVRQFGEHFYESWLRTRNFQIWNEECDEFIFNFFPPYHRATEIQTVSSVYNIGGLLSSFKKTPQNSLTFAERANQYFSHSLAPNKFIAEDIPNGKEDEETKRESIEPSKAWSWGFKR